MPPTPSRSPAAQQPPPRPSDQPLPPGPVADKLAAGAGKAGIVGTVAATGAVVASAAAIAAAVAKILASFLRFQRARRKDEMLLLFQTLKREYPHRTSVEIEAVVSREAEREERFNTRARARLERDLPKALAIPDPDDRRDRVSRILDREKRYVQQREEAMYERAAARAEMLDIKAASPDGAYWRLDPTKKTHTPGCLMMAAVGFWPWEVLDKMHPKLHAGCGCSLSTRAEAEAAGLMHPGQPAPHIPDAIRRARAIAEKTGEISEAATAEEFEAYRQWYLMACQEGVSEEIADLIKSIRKAGFDVCDCGADNLPHEHGRACPRVPEPLHEARWGEALLEAKRQHDPDYVRETAAIKERAQTPEAKKRHVFKPAKWTHPNGHPRCRLCGQESMIGGICNGVPTRAEAQAWADRENKDGMWGTSKWEVNKAGKLTMHLQENQGNLEILALQEARWVRRFPKGDPHGGEFMPHNAVAHLRAEVRKVLRRDLTPPLRTPLQEKGSTQGRYVWMRGRYVFVPRNREFHRKLDHVTFHSPTGSTNIYRNGHLVQIEGQGPPPHHHDLNPPHAADIRNIPGTAEYDEGTKLDPGMTDEEHRRRVQASLTPEQKALVPTLVAKGATEEQAEMLALKGRKTFKIRDDGAAVFHAQGRNYVIATNGRTTFSAGEKYDTGTLTVEPMFPDVSQEHVDAAFALMVAQEENRNALDARVTGALRSQTDAAPPVAAGDYASAAFDVLEAHGFVSAQGRGAHLIRDDNRTAYADYEHRQSRAHVQIDYDFKSGLVTKVDWRPGKAGWDKPREPMSRPPRDWDEWADEVRGIAYRLGHENDAEVLVGEVVRSTEQRPETWNGEMTGDHAGSHNSITGKIVLGEETTDIFSLSERVNASPDSPIQRARNVSEYDRPGVWATYKVSAHEAIHGVNPLGVGEYEGVGRAVEEALTEELAHIEAAKLVRAHQATQALEWYRANPEAQEHQGSYHAYRTQLDRVLNLAGIPVEEREDYIRDLKFKTPTRERFSVLVRAVMAGPHKLDADAADNAVYGSFEGRTSDEIRADAASFVPILRPDLRDFPGPDGVIWKGEKVEPGTVVSLDWGKRIEKRDSHGKLRSRWVKTKVDAEVIKVGQSSVAGQPFKLDVRSLEDGRVFHNVMAASVRGVYAREVTDGAPFDLNETWFLGGGERGTRVGIGAEVRLREGAGGGPGRTMRVVGSQYGKILAVDLDGHPVVHELPNDETVVEVVKEAEQRMLRPGDLIRYDGRADGGMSEARVLGVRHLFNNATRVDPSAPRYVIEAVTTENSLKPDTLVQLTEPRMNGLDIVASRDNVVRLPDRARGAEPIGIAADPGAEGFRDVPAERDAHGVRLAQVRPEHVARVEERFGSPGVGTRRTNEVVPVGTWKRHPLGEVKQGDRIRWATPGESQTHRELLVRADPAVNADGSVTVGEHTLPKGTRVSKEHLKTGFFDLLHQIGQERGHDPYRDRDRTYVTYGALDDVRAKLRALTKPETSHVAVRVQPAAFSSVIASGRIQNGFEDGSLLPERFEGKYAADRREWERRVFSIPDDAPNMDHPVYGYVGSPREDTDRSAAKAFGTIKVTLKDSVRPRTTVNYSDSNYTGVPTADASPVPIDAPTAHGVAPWQMRHFLKVMKPVVERGDKPRAFPAFTMQEESQIRMAGSRFGAATEEERLANMEAERRDIARKKGWEPWRHGDFIEAQIHGGVHMDTDVAHIEFPADYVPSDAIRGRLDQWGIPWSNAPSEEKADSGSSIDDVARWSDQVRKLAAQHDLKWDVSEQWRDAAHASGGTIHTGPLTSQADYFTALHEIGHHDVLRDAKELESAGRNWNEREINREMSSWRFALKHAGEPPNLETRQDIADSLQTYIANEERWNKRRTSPRNLAEAYAFVHDLVGGEKQDPGIDYRGSHQAPQHEPGSSLDDPTNAFGGDDIYGPNGLRYYGSGGPSPQQDPATQAWARRALQADKETLAVIQTARGNPDHEVTVYRAVPKNAPEKINPGDWVTPSRMYAQIHGESNLEAPDGGYDEPSDFKIVSAKVRAGDLFTDGDLNEWGWQPSGEKADPGIGPVGPRAEAVRLTPEEFAAHPDTWWHGTRFGKLADEAETSGQGFHVGTYEAARDALRAQTGYDPGPRDPVEERMPGALREVEHWLGKLGPDGSFSKESRAFGTATGTVTVNGQYLDVNMETTQPHGVGFYTGALTSSTRRWFVGLRVNGETIREPEERVYRGSGKLSGAGPDAEPEMTGAMIPTWIVGAMSNTPSNPHDDFAANGRMKSALKRGVARRGYYYSNISEDLGSISAVLPSRAHVRTHEDFVREAVQSGEHVPAHVLAHYPALGEKADPGTSEIPFAQVVYIAEGVMTRAGLDGGPMVSLHGHPNHPSPEGRAEAERLSKEAQGISGDPDVRVQITDWIDGPGGRDGHASYDRMRHVISIRPLTDRMTFLHEIAHAMTRTNEGEGHTPEFAATLRDLYAKHISQEAGDTFWRIVSFHLPEDKALSFEGGAATRPPTRIKIGEGGDVRSFPRQEMVARDASGAEVGRLDYGYDPDRSILLLGRIDVKAGQRRQGIGGELLNRVRALHPDAKVDPGLLVSQEGKAWWDAMNAASEKQDPGNEMLFWHGTPVADTVKEQGFIFADGVGHGGGPAIWLTDSRPYAQSYGAPVRVAANFRKPLMVTHVGSSNWSDDYEDALKRGGVDTSKYRRTDSGGLASPSVIAREHGFDAVVRKYPDTVYGPEVPEHLRVSPGHTIATAFDLNTLRVVADGEKADPGSVPGGTARYQVRVSPGLTNEVDMLENLDSVRTEDDIQHTVGEWGQTPGAEDFTRAWVAAERRKDGSMDLSLTPEAARFFSEHVLDNCIDIWGDNADAGYNAAANRQYIRAATALQAKLRSGGGDKADPGSSPIWQVPRDEHTGAFPVPPEGEGWGPAQDAHKARGRAWDAATRYALATGKTSLEEAEARGYHPDGPERHDAYTPGSGWQPLPPVLYHVTTAASAVRAQGLRTRAELGQANGVGLGGGADDTISFTTDRRLAEHIEAGMREMRAVARGETTIHELIERAAVGDKGSQPFLDRWMHGVAGSRERETLPPGSLPLSVRLALEGRKQVTSMPLGGVRHDQAEEKLGPGGRAEGEPVSLANETRYMQGSLPESEAGQRERAVHLYKEFSAHREMAGGPADPMFFLSDVEALARTPAHEIETLKFAPRDGGHGFQMGGMREWRTTTGDAVALLDPRPYSVTPEPPAGEKQDPGSDTLVRPRISVPMDPEGIGLTRQGNDTQSVAFERWRDAMRERTGQLVRGDPITHDDQRVPATLYHATTNLPAVMNDGMLRASGAGGLGGDNRDKIVSLTTRPEVAAQLAADLHLVGTLGRAFGDMPEQTFNKKTSTWEPDRSPWGQRIGEYLREEAKRQGFDFHREYLERDAEQQERDRRFREGMERGSDLGGWISQFFMSRQTQTGVPDPIIFNGTETAKSINPDKVGVVEVPRENLDTGALITDFDLHKKRGLSEVRVYGDVPVSPMWNEMRESAQAPPEATPPGGDDGVGGFSESSGPVHSLYDVLAVPEEERALLTARLLSLETEERLDFIDDWLLDLGVLADLSDLLA